MSIQVNKIEENLKSPIRIMFANFTLDKQKYPNVESFFKNFYHIEKEHPTISEYGTFVCKEHTFARSFKEIFNVCKFYYPRTTLKSFVSMLSRCDLVGHYCGDIHNYCIAHGEDYAKGGWSLCNPTAKVADFLGYSLSELYKEINNKEIPLL